jgi:hypothetical protein
MFVNAPSRFAYKQSLIYKKKRHAAGVEFAQVAINSVVNSVLFALSSF